jgi:hypothetical protein
MGNIITIQVPDTEENKAIIAQLIGVPGVRIETGAVGAGRKKYVSLQEGAAIAGVNYFTFRKWVVEEKRIPYERPSGMQQGGVRLLVDNIEAYLEGRGVGNGRKKPRRGGGVKILD